MSSKVWRVTGKYKKRRKIYRFLKEIISPKESHVRERILSELGSRHRVKRKDIVITKVEEIKPEDVSSLELRTLLGVESEL
ncbi:MAG: 50S ribosomal protein L18Ae [Candidatus Thorarchaeota archaeon]|jgi:large subunit ribosomal protein LX